jgi:hypothetical protein
VRALVTPPGVVMVVLTEVGLLAAGGVAQIRLSLLMVGTTVVPPNVTRLAPVRPIPLNATLGGPASGPDAGVISLRVGGAAYL